MIPFHIIATVENDWFRHIEFARYELQRTYVEDTLIGGEHELSSKLMIFNYLEELFSLYLADIGHH
jgi:hypothetical protein